MKTQYGFILGSIQDFEAWIRDVKVGRTVVSIQQHHTYSPDYSSFKGSNQFELQKAMKDYHVVHNGWSDIGQHFTTFPDGSIITGRSMELSPAGIKGCNSASICIEHLGNFDAGKNEMTFQHQDIAVRLTAALCLKFGLPVSTKSILYHHWFNLATGERNNGTKNNKSCPGTAFFGGNKVQDCDDHFLPLVSQCLKEKLPQLSAVRPMKYVCVTADSLNVRERADGKSKKVSERSPVSSGSILRVWKEENGWYKISESSEHWVSGKFTRVVQRATVNADTLRARSGPSVSCSVVGAYLSGQELFIEEVENKWGRVSMDGKWVSMKYLDMN
ncbi:MAG: amidase [Chlorobiaceae bacterium]|jgi:hypothetical protein|nr:amidase [Chlorobiaceae bacterium]